MLASPFGEHVKEHGEDLTYVLMGAFAVTITKSAQAGATDEFDSVFRAIEGLLSEGDRDARTLVAVGLLEDLQTYSGNVLAHGSKYFLPWLGPASRECWDYIQGLWDQGGNTLMGVVRRGYPATPPWEREP